MVNNSVTRRVTVCHPNGLHLRPAHALVTLAGGFSSSIEITRLRDGVSDGEDADAKSILAIIGLGAEKGTQLIIRATGHDANEALTAISEWFGRDITEGDDKKTDQSETDGQQVT